MTGILEELGGKSIAQEGQQVSSWDVRPFQLVSLLDMKKYHLLHLQNIALQVVGLIDNVIGDNYSAARPKDDAIISREHHNGFEIAVDGLDLHLRYLNLKESRKYVKTMREKLSEKFDRYTYGEYERDVEILQGRIDDELQDIICGFIPADKAKYFENNELFGAEVNNNFPSAVEDIREAGNCYAHGNDTATVFHLMRVVEHGLRALAVKLRVTFKTKKGASVPIELQQWETIIAKIESKIEDLKNLAKSRRKSEDLQFYSEAAKEFRYFKEAWRNHVSHSRVMYDKHDAAKVMEHVGDFMKHLATRLKEPKKRAK